VRGVVPGPGLSFWWLHVGGCAWYVWGASALLPWTIVARFQHFEQESHRRRGTPAVHSSCTMGTARTAATQSRLLAYPDAIVAGEAHGLALAECFASYATAMRAVRRSTPFSRAGSRSGSGAWTRTSPAEGPVPSPRGVLAVRNSEGCVAWSHQRGRMVRAQSGRQTTIGERPRSNGCVGARCMDSFLPPGSRSRKA
jgi:hypothetical protein